MKIKILIKEENYNGLDNSIAKLKNSLSKNSNKDLRSRLKQFSAVLDEIYENYGENATKKALNTMSMMLMRLNPKEVDYYLEVLSHKPYSNLL